MIQPVNDKILIKPVKEEEKKTQSGLFIPESAKLPSATATVVAVSKDITDIKEGDKIIYDAGSGAAISYDGQELLMIIKPNVWAIL